MKINKRPISVSILLCTYNGEHALKEQIESILSQTYKEWNLYVHDDGSTDSTLDIINHYIKIYSNIYLIEDSIKGRGARDSFMWLLEHIESDYYMFCDQDDIWLDNKIELTINKLKELEDNDKIIPVIVHSDLIVVDSYLNLISGSFWKYSKISPNLLTNMRNLQILNCVTGCAMGFNKAAKLCSLPMNELAPMHDWWIALSTLKANGIIEIIAMPTIKYRQHSKNVVGARNIGMKYVFNKMRTVISVINENEKHYRFLKSFSGMNRFRYYLTKLILSVKRFYYVS